MRLRRLLPTLALAIMGCGSSNCAGLQEPGPADSGVPAPPPAPKVIEWFDHGPADMMARQGGKRLLVFAYADWCHYCRKVENEVMTDPEIIDIINEGYVATILNVDEHEDLVERYGIKGVPRLIVMDGDTEVNRIKGYYPNIDVYRDGLRYRD